MKRVIFLPIIILLIFSSCVKESKNCDIYEFGKRINTVKKEEIFNTDDLFIDNKNTAYWCYDKNTCISFYINNDTGNIEKCNVAFKNKKANDEILSIIRKALTFNNEYIYETEFKTEKYCLISFVDKRFEKEKTESTLKKEIKEEDLY